MIVFTYGLFILFPLVIIIMNGREMAHRRTNKICALAIITTMLSLMVTVLANIGAEATHIPLNLIDILALVKTGLDLIAILLAIIGITQCLMKRRYVKGRWRAAVAILISGTYTYFTTVRIIEGVNEGIAWQQLLRPKEGTGKSITNETWNFRVTAPESWNEVSTDAFPTARLAFQRKKPDMLALIFAEDLPDGSELTLADYMDMQKKTIRENTKGAEFLGEEEKSEGTFTARTMEMRGHELLNPQFHVFWIIRDGNTMYRIATWGPNSNAKDVREEAQKIMRGFDLIQHRKNPKSSPKPTVAILSPAGPY